MSENTNSKLDLKFAFAPHYAPRVRAVMASAPRALAVIAVQDVDDETADAALNPPLEVISAAEGADELRELADIFTILGEATREVADKMDAQSVGEEGR